MNNRLFALILFGGGTLGTGLVAQSFDEVSLEAGIQTAALDPELIAGGVVSFDYNNDYYPDLLFLNGDLQVRLYRNNWDGTFTDVTEASRLTVYQPSMGGVAADFDGDGFLDVFITTKAGHPCRLFKNNGDGTFSNRTAEAGLTELAYNAGATVGDPDGDGDVDIYVANYLAGALPREGGERNFFYRNDGDFHFTEVAAELGIDEAGCGLGAVFADLTGNGLQDLHVANDFGYLITPNAYYQNDGPGEFTSLADLAGTALTINAMGTAVGDYDRDGWLDLYITNIRNNVHFNNTDGGDFFSYFSNRTLTTLAELTSWGTAFIDLDLDGWLDLPVANGQVSFTDNFPEPQTLFRNAGDGTFSDESAASGFGLTTMGRGLVVPDLDLDGLPDIVINSVLETEQTEDHARIFRNTTATDGHFLSVQVPLGLSVSAELHAGGESLLRTAPNGSSYLSHTAGPVHFSLADAPAIDSLTLTLADGRTLSYSGFDWNQLIHVHTDGNWERVEHRTELLCADAGSAGPPASSLITDDDGIRVRELSRTITLPYPRLDTLVVELAPGDLYRGVAISQDTDLTDTIATGGTCPALQLTRLRVSGTTEDQPVFYPNPFSEEVTIRLLSDGGTARVVLSAASGELLLDRHYELPSGERRIGLPLRDLTAGVYFCSVTHGGKTTRHKLYRN